MTLFSTKALENARPGDVPAMRVGTKYMETFLPLDPISSGTEIHPFQNRNGALDIYSVGSNRRIYRYSRSENQAAPFEETDLGVDATQLYLFDASNETSEHPDIFGLDTKGKLVFSHFDGGTYSRLSTGPQDKVIRKFLGARGATGKIYINVVLDDGSLGTNYFHPLTQEWGADSWAPMLGPDDQPAIVKDIAMAANDPVQSAIFAIGQDDEVLFAEESFRTSTLRKLYKKATHIAAISDSNDLLNIFAVEKGTGDLYVKTQRKHSIQGKIQFEDWVLVESERKEKLGRLRVNLRKDGLIEVFALDRQNDIIYTRQTTDDRRTLTGWRRLFPIAAGNENAIFAVGRNGNGYSEAFSVNAKNELLRFWQSPETEQWFSEVLDIPKAEGKLISVPTHSTEIVISDKFGQPMMGAPVTINTTFLSTIWVNGHAYRSSLFDAVHMKTDITGKVVVLQRANALSGATMLVSTPLTGAGSPIKVQPNAELQARLSEMTKKDILNAKDRDGKLILAADTENRDRIAETLSEVTKRSMDIAQADDPAAHIQYKFASPYGTGFKAETDFSSLGETYWEIDFINGMPIYKNSNRAGLEAFKADHAHLQTEGGGFLRIDWGHVWNAIKEGVNWVVNGLEKIVVSIVNGIAKVIFKIAGQIFEAILKFAQQAFDFIEGIWNWLKVKLEKLFEWLAFLFDFKDFARTADGIKHSVDVVLDFSVFAVKAVKGDVKQGFEKIKNSLEDTIDKLVAQLNADGDPSIGSYNNRLEPNEKNLNASEHNIFLNAYQENKDNVIVKPGGQIEAFSLSGPLEAVFDKMSALAENFQFCDGKKALDEAVTYFSRVGSEPGKATQLILSGLIKVLEGIALFALDFAEGIVLSLLDLVVDVLEMVKSALFEAWEIPVVSQLYELFTGETLAITPIDVAAFVVAIPMTITSKIILGRTPWNEEELKTFKENFTVDYLRSRINPGSEIYKKQSDVPEEWSGTLRTLFLVGCSGTMLCRVVIDPLSIGVSATATASKATAIVSVAARLLTTIFTAPWALSPKAGGFSCKSGSPGFSVTIWTMQLIFGPLVGAAWGLQTKWEGEQKAAVGEVLKTLWGCGHLIMVAVNYNDQEKNKANNLAFSRAMVTIIPGQTLRFGAIPALNKDSYFIPAAILGVLSFGGCIAAYIIAAVEAGMDIETAQGYLMPKGGFVD